MAASDTFYEEISQAITIQRAQVAEAIVAAYYSARPDLLTRDVLVDRMNYLQDINFHVSYLAQAIAISSPELFTNYVAWAKLTNSERDLPVAELISNLADIRDVLGTLLPDRMQPTIMQYVEAGLDQCTIITPDPPSFLPTAAPHADLARHYLDALLAADRDRASTLILDAIQAGVRVSELYIHVFQPSQQEVGRLWQLNQVSVAQEHYCSAATQLIMSQLYAHILGSEKNGHTIVAACVAEDLHEIGVRMVADFFEMEGWKTIYLGANTPVSSIVTTLNEQRADILALSATMPYHIQSVVDVIKAVRASDARQVKVLVGGHSFNRTPDLWKKIGADGFAADAATALVVAHNLLNS